MNYGRKKCTCMDGWISGNVDWVCKFVILKEKEIRMIDKNKVPTRAQIKEKDKWRIEDLYRKDEIWEKDFQKVQELTKEVAGYQGTMQESAEQLYLVLKKQDELGELLEKVYVYASQKNHEDMSNAVYQELFGRAQMIMTQTADAISFVEPELLSIPFEQVQTYMREKAELSQYKRFIEEKFRAKEHILSEEMEAVLAKASELGRAPQTIYQMFNNADIDLGSITDGEGNEVQLSHARFIQLMESKNREMRKTAFETYYRAYEKNKNTLAAIFQANVQQELFFAKMRNYPSARAAALDASHIPETVYDKLIEAVHENLPAMYKYVSLRRKVLGLEELHMYDVYVPLVEQSDKKYSFEEAKEIVRKGLAPLGTEYLNILEEGFSGGWIDVYENQGKRSGAYSWGAYGTHPYVLLNYNGSLNHVFTLAHEMGHAIHSYHSDHALPYTYAGYHIFVAEVASTCNEALLIHYLLEQAADEKEKAYLVNHFLDQCKGTIFRQTMFAEFEKITHEKVQNGEILTTECLCEIYHDLNKLYFGEEMVSDPQISLEWSRIPHFYTPFYVYQYATGFSAAIAISNKILAGEKGIIEKYRKFLSSGSSMDCIDLLKICDVDMESPKPVEDALRVFAEYVEKLEELIA